MALIIAHYCDSGIQKPFSTFFRIQRKWMKIKSIEPRISKNFLIVRNEKIKIFEEKLMMEKISIASFQIQMTRNFLIREIPSCGVLDRNFM